jgi:uncharacterized phage-associated protein
MPARAGVATVDDVAAALLKQLGPMDAMKLQKLLYYAQGWHLAITDRPLFTEQMQAWRDGPVVYSVFDQHRGRRHVSAWPSGSPQHLNTEARHLVALVCLSYGHLSGDELSRLTHSEEPWLVARQGLGPCDYGNNPISDAALKDYFYGKELAGRTSADLAAGGLTVAPTEHSELPSEELDSIRREFSGPPAAHPDDSFGVSGRSRTGIDRDISDRLAARRARRIAH